MSQEQEKKAEKRVQKVLNAIDMFAKCDGLNFDQIDRAMGAIRDRLSVTDDRLSAPLRGMSESFSFSDAPSEE